MCSSTTTVTVSTAVHTTSAISALDVFPNPATRTVTVKASINTGSSVELMLVNMLGEIVYRKTISNQGAMNENIDVSTLAEGAYFVQLRSDMGSSYIKLIKE
jgi:hypothetical protein